uniref:Methylosome subunit pICln n=1 Tax=Lepeophtheirus salmonis TaxID=72036 RepID=C1BUE5_LEPSM|nr:Methylosome subunit pICln [Lepeophtheirus salmonis]
MVVLTSLGPPEEGVRHVESNTKVFFNSRGLGLGTLYISESRVSWVGEGNGFSLEYPHIALHAVSKDLSAFPEECLYLMIDVRLMESEDPTPASSVDGDDNDENDDQSSSGMTEVRFVPQDKSKLDTIFRVLSQCQSLHPDPEDVSSGDELNGNDEDNEDNEDFINEGGVYDDAEEDEPMDER